MTISDLNRFAIRLHGLTQGLRLLMDDDTQPALDAAWSLAAVIDEDMCQLSAEIGRLNDENNRRGAAIDAGS